MNLTPKKFLPLASLGVQILSCLVVPVVAMAALQRGRIKSYLRSTMVQEKFTLHVHNDSIDSVDLVEVVKQFVSGNE